MSRWFFIGLNDIVIELSTTAKSLRIIVTLVQNALDQFLFWHCTNVIVISSRGARSKRALYSAHIWKHTRTRLMTSPFGCYFRASRPSPGLWSSLHFLPSTCLMWRQITQTERDSFSFYQRDSHFKRALH